MRFPGVQFSTRSEESRTFQVRVWCAGVVFVGADLLLGAAQPAAGDYEYVGTKKCKK